MNHRADIVMGRCSPFAAELLRDLTHHPTFPLVVAKLVKIDGTIFRTDVEYAVLDILQADD